MLHHTHIEARSPWSWRLQSAIEGALCGLDTSQCPRTVLYIGGATRRAGARGAQARGRGSTRVPSATLAASYRAGAEVQSQRRAQGKRPRCSAVFATPGYACALSLGASRARPVRRPAPPLIEPGRNRRIAKAVCRVNIKETARASCWAKPVQALPWPCFFSKRVKSFCPMGAPP
jgi:hypothetical protein